MWYALVGISAQTLYPHSHLILFKEIAFTDLCARGFSGPRDERDDDETNQDWPDSDPRTDDPDTGACDCNESSCTPDSPACCANGSC